MKFTEEKLWYLIELYDMRSKELNITALAQRLGIAKSTLSRVLSFFYAEGMTLEKGSTQLSEEGVHTAEKWKRDIRLLKNWLMESGGLNDAEAEQEAFGMALKLSENGKQKMLAHISTHSLFDKLHHIREVSGDYLAMHLSDGEYPFAFTIYREKFSDGKRISMANDAFLHPGILQVQEGKCWFCLTACTIERVSFMGRMVLRGRASELSYFLQDTCKPALRRKDTFCMLANDIMFHFNGSERILQASLKIKVQADVGILHMPESNAILTVLFK